MKTYQLAGAMALAFIAHAPAWAVYKCQDASGRTSFQQAPCAGAMQGEKLNVQPASGHSPRETAPTVTPGAPLGTASAPMTETDRLNALSGRLAKENRLATLNNLTIGGAQGEIFRVQKRCQSELNAVRNRKALANNNLAGATWEQSLSTEMQAIAAQCDTEQRRLQANLDRFLAEKQEIERELAKP